MAKEADAALQAVVDAVAARKEALRTLEEQDREIDKLRDLYSSTAEAVAGTGPKREQPAGVLFNMELDDQTLAQYPDLKRLQESQQQLVEMLQQAKEAQAKRKEAEKAAAAAAATAPAALNAM